MESDFRKNIDIPLDKEVWYDGKYGIAPYKCMIKNLSVYLVKLEGTISDLVYLGNNLGRCEGVFKTVKSAYEYQAVKSEEEAQRLRTFMYEWKD